VYQCFEGKGNEPGADGASGEKDDAWKRREGTAEYNSKIISI